MERPDSHPTLNAAGLHTRYDGLRFRMREHQRRGTGFLGVACRDRPAQLRHLDARARLAPAAPVPGIRRIHFGHVDLFLLSGRIRWPDAITWVGGGSAV